MAEGSFRALKGLLTPDRMFMAEVQSFALQIIHDKQCFDEETLCGYLFAMINGDICHRIPDWALH